MPVTIEPQLLVALKILPCCSTHSFFFKAKDLTVLMKYFWKKSVQINQSYFYFIHTVFKIADWLNSKYVLPALLASLNASHQKDFTAKCRKGSINRGQQSFNFFFFFLSEKLQEELGSNVITAVTKPHEGSL